MNTKPSLTVARRIPAQPNQPTKQGRPSWHPGPSAAAWQRYFLGLLTPLVLVASWVQGQTMQSTSHTLYPAMVVQGLQTNSSSAWLLTTNASGRLNISRDSAGNPYRQSAVLDFDLSTLPTNRVVISAKLSFFGLGWTIPVNAAAVSLLDSEGPITGVDASASTGTYVTTFTYSGIYQYRVYRDITAAIQAAVQQGRRSVRLNVHDGTGWPWRNGAVQLSSPLLEVKTGLTVLSLAPGHASNGTRCVLLSFPSRVGQSYSVQKSSDSKSWQTFLPNIAGTGNVITVTNVVSETTDVELFRISGN